MNDFRADLHIHTICSDGTDLPLEILHKAKEAGLSGLSITDHDTTEAYTPELFFEAAQLGLSLLSGIEISSDFGDATVHILGYGYDIDSPPFKAFLQEMQERRMKRNRVILEKLKKKNIFIEEEELIAFAKKGRKEKTIGRPHIAELMVQKGHVPTRQTAFDLYLKEGACCFAFGFKYDPGEVIAKIQEAKGKAVLAHPHFYKKGAFLKKLLSFPFDGIECYYGNLAKELEIPWVAVAKERGWIATGGSDYHGAMKPYIYLGASYVNKETFDLLFKKSP